MAEMDVREPLKQMYVGIHLPRESWFCMPGIDSTMITNVR